MVAWWVMAIIYAVTTVLSGLLAKAPNQKAAALGDMQVPTAEEGRNLPVFWGTCCLKSPNVIWYGDYKVKKIEKAIMGGIGGHVTVGHKYHLGMDLGLCHGPVDELVAIMAGSGEDYQELDYSGGVELRSPGEAYYGIHRPSPVPVTNADGSIRLFIASRNIFGGKEKEGGIEGYGTFYPGNTTQGSDTYMSARLGIAYPAYRNICHFVANRLYLGTSQYIKNLAFVLRRCPSNLGLSSAQTNINGDANPAEMIFECLHAQAWALGFPVSNFDMESFRSAGSTLAEEGMGMSLQLDNPKQADQVIETILQHIDGVCYTDPSTGLWTLKLVRPDYDPEDLPEFGPDDVAECEYSRGSWEDTLNEVKVTYTDRTKWKTSQVQAQDGANYSIRSGELASKTIDFSGFTSAVIAQKAANRELKMLSYPIGRGRLKVNRKAWALRMSSPFKITWPPLGISDMCVRVTSISYGTLTDGMIEIEFCEDLFTAAYAGFAAPVSGEWTDPCVQDPAQLAAKIAFEAPYQMLNGSTAPRVMVGAVRGDDVSHGFEICTDEGSGYRLTNTASTFCPAGTLTAPYSRMTDAIDVTGFTLAEDAYMDDLESIDEIGRDAGKNLLLFADTGEICAWQSITQNENGTYAITGTIRGVYDTCTADHAQGVRVYFIRAGGMDNLVDYKDETLPDSGDDSVILND